MLLCGSWPACTCRHRAVCSCATAITVAASCFGRGTRGCLAGGVSIRLASAHASTSSFVCSLVVSWQCAAVLVVICAAALPPSQWLLAELLQPWDSRCLAGGVNPRLAIAHASTSSFIGSLVVSWQCAAVLVVICAVTAVALPPSQWLLAELLQPWHSRCLASGIRIYAV